MTFTPPLSVSAVRTFIRERFSEEVLARLPDEAFTAVAHDVEAIVRASLAARIAIAGEVSARSERASGSRLLTLIGARNGTEALQRFTGESAATARTLLDLGSHTRTVMSDTGEECPAAFPVIAEALRNGELPVDHAAQVVRHLRDSRSHVPEGDLLTAEVDLVSTSFGRSFEETTRQFVPEPLKPLLRRAAEETLLLPGAPTPIDSSQDLPQHADDTGKRARQWREALDEHRDFRHRELQSYERRYIRVRGERDGLHRIDGNVIPQVAALLESLLHTVTSPRIDNGALTAPSRLTRVQFVGGDADEVEPMDQRTQGQKHHDALEALLGALARHPEVPMQHGAPVTVMVRVNAADLATTGGLGWISDAHGTPSPISLEGVAHAACIGGLQRIITEDNGRVIELGNAQRTFTPHQRRAILFRDGGCVIPGCNTPPSWCEVHHVIPYAQGGETHIANGCLMCTAHHRTVNTTLGWHVRIRDGIPQVKPPPGLRSRTPPTGWVTAKRPAGLAVSQTRE